MFVIVLILSVVFQIDCLRYIIFITFNVTITCTRFLFCNKNVQNQNQIKHVKKTNKNVKPVVERVLSFDIKMNLSGVFYHFITKCCR